MLVGVDQSSSALTHTGRWTEDVFPSMSAWLFVL